MHLMSLRPSDSTSTRILPQVIWLLKLSKKNNIIETQPLLLAINQKIRRFMWYLSTGFKYLSNFHPITKLWE